MRIVYLHSFFNTLAMAGGTRVFDMASRLVAWGHEVHVVTSDREAANSTTKGWRLTEEAGIQVHWLRVPYSNHMNYRQRIAAFLTFAFASARKVAALKGDLIFASSPPLTVALPAIFAAKANRLPLVFEVRDLWPEIPIAMGVIRGGAATYGARRLEHFAYKSSARIVTLSPMAKDRIVHTHAYFPSHIHVIPNSADMELFDVPSSVGKNFRARYAWLGDRPLVLYAGTLGVLNNVSYLVRLASAIRVRAPEVRFLIVGGGKEEELVKNLAKELGILDETLFMVPWFPKQDMPALLSAATLAVSIFSNLEAMWSNSSKKFFDALASGTPFAINYGGWQADLLRESGCGLVLHPTDTDDAGDTLLSALNDEDWLEQAGRRAQQLGQERFALNKLTKELENVLTQVVDGTGRKKTAG